MVAPRQIGESRSDQLLAKISKQLDRLIKVTGKLADALTTTTTTTTS